MPSPDSTTKTARMSATTWDTVSREMEEEGVTFSGWVRKRAEERVHPTAQKGAEDKTPKNLTPDLGTPSGFVPLSEYNALLDELREERTGKPIPFEEDYGSLAKLKSYAPLFGLKEEEYIGKIVEAIDGGVLMYENEHFVGVGNLDTSEFEDKCRLNGENAQKALDKIARGM